MAASPVEHAEQARLALRTIVAEHGPETLSNPRVLSNLLSDLLPDSPRISRLLVTAAQDRIADDLRAHTSDGMDADTASRLVASTFADATMFDPVACHWIVGEIALALGLKAEPEHQSPSATARFVAGPEVNTQPAPTEPASLAGQGVPEPRLEASPRPVWPNAQSGPAGQQPAPAGQQPEPTGPQPEPTGPTAPPPLTWTATVTADRAYFHSVIADGHVEVSSIPFPDGYPTLSFELSGPRMQIGRRSVSRGLNPEIDLAGPPLDPGISHVHAVLVVREDGSWAVEDQGSSNGTQVNGDEIEVGVPVVLHDGDRICLGAWTVVTVRSS